MADEEPINWNVDLEVCLFHAMRKHKPVGLNRHFQMIFIHDKLNNTISRKVSSNNIWEHLGTMYDLSALNESEIMPFPNKEIDFMLPVEYSGLISKEYPRVQKDFKFKETPVDDTRSLPVFQPVKGTPKTKEKDAIGTSTVITKADHAEDSPKREQRKRTRLTGNQSPITTADNQPSIKGTKVNNPIAAKRTAQDNQPSGKRTAGENTPSTKRTIGESPSSAKRSSGETQLPAKRSAGENPSSAKRSTGENQSTKRSTGENLPSAKRSSMEHTSSAKRSGGDNAPSAKRNTGDNAPSAKRVRRI